MDLTNVIHILRPFCINSNFFNIVKNSLHYLKYQFNKKLYSSGL
jgi:hypothetical protein